MLYIPASGPGASTSRAHVQRQGGSTHQKECPGGGSAAPSGQEANSRREGVVCSDDALDERLTGPARTVLHMPKMPAMGAAPQRRQVFSF